MIGPGCEASPTLIPSNGSAVARNFGVRMCILRFVRGLAQGEEGVGLGSACCVRLVCGVDVCLHGDVCVKLVRSVCPSLRIGGNGVMRLGKPACLAMRMNARRFKRVL